MNNDQYLQCGDFQVPHPMKYQTKPTQARLRQVFNSNDWLMSEKKDGSFFQLIVNKNGDVGLFSRTISRKNGEYVNKIANVPHIEKFGLSLPANTILLGEIYFHGSKSNLITKVMGCLPKTAIARQEDGDTYGGKMRYYIFDCLMYDGEELINTPFEKRIEYFKKLPVNDNIDIAENWGEDFEKHLRDIFNSNGEGAVFKRKDMLYEPGKRPSSCFKWKKHLDSVDLICIRLEDPEYYYTGKEIETWPYWMEHAKAIDGENLWYPIFGLYYERYKKHPHAYKPVTKPAFYSWKNSMSLGCYKDGKIVYVGKVASGLTDSMRQDMAEHPEKYLNKVIQVSCMSVDPKEGTLRHPVFEQIREDKNPEECIYEEIFK